MKFSSLILLFIFSISLKANTGDIQKAKHFSKKAPWAFEENRGQVTGTDSSKVKFFYKQNSVTMFILNSGIAYQFEKMHYPEGFKRPSKFALKNELDSFHELSKQVKIETYRMDIELVGANPNPEIIKEGESPDYIQYYNHNVLGVHAYQKIIYKNIYPNIDWVIYLNSKSTNDQGLLTNDFVKYDFIVHPGGNPADIKLKSKWAENIKIDADGSLVFKTSMGSITDNAPISFQENIPIQSQFKLNDSLISFQISDYDKSKDIIIDPSVVWSTYYGENQDLGYAISIDNSNNVYLCGETWSSTNIASGGFQNNYSWNGDVYLVKFNKDGSRIWATYYGGYTWESYPSTTIDKFNNVYLSGTTESSTLISYNGYQNNYKGTCINNGNIPGDLFLVKFDSSCNRIWATYYGDTCDEFGASCSVDTFGNVYLSGDTYSSGLATSGAFKTNLSGEDAILVKFNSNGGRVWATYFGGPSGEYNNTCSSDLEGNIYLHGGTYSSSNIASTGAYQTSYKPSYLAKFNSLGQRMWSTYIRGELYHFANYFKNISTDIKGNIYIVNTALDTHSTGFNVYQSTFGGGNTDALLSKYNSYGQLIWSTFFGGNGRDKGFGVCVNKKQEPYLVGGTASNNILMYKGMISSYKGASVLQHIWHVKDGFIAKFDSTGQRVWSSYYGDTSDDYASGCAVDLDGNVYFGGQTFSQQNIAYNGFKNTSVGMDGFLTRVTERPIVEITGGTFCKGNSIISFKTLIAGQNPKFKWYVNNVYRDSTLSFVNYLNDGDSVYCLVKSKDTTFIIDTSYSNIVRFNILPFYSDTTRDTICSNQFYSFYGSLVNKKGTVIRYLGKKSNNCDSFAVLILHVKKVDTTRLNYELCFNDSFIYKGKIFKKNTLIKDTLKNKFDCDSLLLINLKIDTIQISKLINDSICFGSSVLFNGQNHLLSGIYKDTFTSQKGCDSIVTLRLYVRKIDSTHIYDSICIHNSVLFNNLIINKSGVYIDTLTNNKGCDSMIFLHLNIKPIIFYNIYDTICSNQTYPFNSRLLNTTGIYKDTFTSSSGCDSFVFLHLEVKPFSFSSYNHTTTCTNPNYFFNNQTLSQSGAYKDTFIAANGCDSIVTVFLTVKGNTSSSLNPFLCPGQSYFFNGQNRTTAGTYTQTLTNSVGCDSIITLTLSYLTTPTGVNNIIWACNPYIFNGKTYTSNAIVIDTVKSSFGCDSLYLFNYIYLKSAPITLSNIPITVCDSVTIKNIVHKTSFSYTDTTRTTQNVVCDSLYQITNYTIKYTPTIILSTKQEDTFFKGENIIISANNIKNYRWSTGETKRDISFKLTQNESIFLIAWNDPECQDTAYTNITALDATILEFPTGFSPSSKKPENQVFRPNIVGKIERIQLEIFNRLGEKVYSSNNIFTLGWDGTNKGVASPQGVYTYLIEYVTNKRIFFKSGEVELVR